MIETWFLSIVEWFKENSTNIFAFCTSTAGIALITQIILIIRQIKATKKNNDTSSTLNKTVQTDLKNTVKATDTLSANMSEVQVITNDNLKKTAVLNAQMSQLSKETNSNITAMTNKLNLLLDALSVVYTTIPDENIRASVTSMLANAKATDSETTESLREQVNSLTKQLLDMSEQVFAAKNTKVEETEAATVTAENIVSAIEVAKNVVEASKEIVTRY